MLLAYEKGAALIVSVGAHFNLIEFLDKNRGRDVLHVPDPAAHRRDAGRRQGREPALQPGRRGWHLSIFLLVSLLLMVIVVVSSPALGNLFDLVAEDQGRR